MTINGIDAIGYQYDLGTKSHINIHNSNAARFLKQNSFYPILCALNQYTMHHTF